MDIAFVIISMLLIIAGLMMGMLCDIDKFISKLIIILISSGFALVIWSVCATTFDDGGEKIITLHRIEERKNVSFYINENDNPIKLSDNWQVADPNKYQIRITITKGHWKYGIYVTGTRAVELVKIDTPEKN